VIPAQSPGAWAPDGFRLARSLWLSVFLVLSALPALAGTICGHVTDTATGLPVAGAGVFIREPAGQYAGALAVSDNAGAWCIDGLLPGTYTLEFRVDDYVTAYVNNVVVADDVSDVPVALVPAAVVFDPPWPNPASGAVKMRLHVARTTAVELAIYDARGRLVRSWTADAVDAGTRDYAWDGRDASGRDAPAGLYLVRVRSGGRQITRSLIMTR